MIDLAIAASSEYGPTVACRAFGVSRATFYRHRDPQPPEDSEMDRHPRRLSKEEEQIVLDTLNSEEYMDDSVPEVYADLLDQGTYLCSQRTMYRILEANKAVRERRDQRRHPEYTKPELLACAPNQVWSWDITKLKGPQKWSHFHLYVIMDIYSRCVVGWMVASRESASLAERLIMETCEKQGITKEQLTIHADRGTSMRSKLVAQLMADLGITKTHSRPHTSNDNPYSEAQFKTLKYHYTFPKSFGCIEDAQVYLRGFFEWYNHVHKHSGIGYLTPQSLHSGQAQTIREERCSVLAQAYKKHPERFVKGRPQPPRIPTAAWINKPAEDAA
ncbi:MAG: IS3 family transposase [Gammaproteobacteria bacterium]|nr:IS3 family transposase [Gammaproteobacteria bacterium]